MSCFEIAQILSLQDDDIRCLFQAKDLIFRVFNTCNLGILIALVKRGGRFEKRKFARGPYSQLSLPSQTKTIVAVVIIEVAICSNTLNYFKILKFRVTFLIPLSTCLSQNRISMFKLVFLESLWMSSERLILGLCQLSLVKSGRLDYMQIIPRDKPTKQV